MKATDGSLPVDEAERLKALRRYKILDTDPEQDFDDITLLASQLCGTPIALLTLLDENRQWIKSTVGIILKETPRDVAFCAHTILQKDVLVVEDAQADERFAANPLVTAENGIRFYAGAPLMTADGHALGSLCVIDLAPRALNAAQKTALQALSRQVVAQLELRRNLTELRQTVIQLQQTEQSLRESTRLAELETAVRSALSGSETQAEMLRLCSAAIVRHLDAAFARIWVLNEREQVLELHASAGLYTHLDGPHSRVPVGTLKIGLIAQELKPHRTNQVVGDPRVGDQEWAKREGMVAFAGYPLLIEGRLVGVVAMFARHPLAATTLTALEAIANYIALGIERKRTEEELQRQKAELQLLFDVIPAMVCFKDTHNGFLRVNHRLAEAVGKSVEEIEGRSALELFPQEAAKFYADDLEVIQSGRAKLGIIDSFRDGENREFYFQTDKAPVFDLDGKVTGLVVMTQDITERKNAEEELRWKTAFLEAQVNSSNDGMLVVDERGKKILHNQRFAALLKIPQHILDDKDVAPQIRWMADAMKNPAQFIDKVAYLYAHPNEVSDDELELKDGTILERYTSGVIGTDGKYYGRIWTYRDITGRRQADEALRLLSSAVEQSKESIMITDADLNLPGPKILFVNPAFTRMTGYTAEEALGKTPRILQGPLTDKMVLARLRKNLQRGEVFAGETINYRRDGTEFNLEWQIAPLRNKVQAITHYVAIQHDITERKRLEIQLIQSQKMETVGKLAGGIAHEFNSILTAIIGQGELLLDDLPEGSSQARSATEIIRAAGRVAILTRQLLAYGRKQFLQPETLDLNRVIAGMASIFQHLMGGAVDTQIVPAPDLRAVLADAGQIEQVIMNLVINAREAMPKGGKLIVETANVTLDEEYVSHFPEAEVKAGEYVLLAISDTGAGMSGEVKARVFEPFFSTKEVGQGTGLGLATCYGIVKQSGGHISVYSEPGRGSTFKVYLPQVEAQTKKPLQRPDSPGMPRGTETILLVEDDPALREMAATLLRRLGYTVLAAADGIEALRLKQERGSGHVDLLFTDVVMPHMSGKELADRVGASYPHTRILFTSAYTENAMVSQGALHNGVALLQKPFTPSALAHKLREVLDQSAGSNEPLR